MLRFHERRHKRTNGRRRPWKAVIVNTLVDPVTIEIVPDHLCRLTATMVLVYRKPKKSTPTPMTCGRDKIG